MSKKKKPNKDSKNKIKQLDLDNQILLSESKKYEKVKLSVLNLGYLDELLAYCELNNVKPILLRSPVHPACTCLDNEDL